MLTCAATTSEKSLSSCEGSEGSSEEVESPRSVGRRRRMSKKMMYNVHNQILRIIEEDSKSLGESDLIAIEMAIDKIKLRQLSGDGGVSVSSHVVLFSRPILPASPLSGKTVQ